MSWLTEVAFRHADNDSTKHGGWWCRFCDWLIWREGDRALERAAAQDKETPA